MKKKIFKYKIEAIQFIQTHNLSMDCLKGTYGRWVVEYE